MYTLLTGSSGFIGRNLHEYLISVGRKVIAPDENQLDLTDFQDVKNYFDSYNISKIVHSATALRNKTDYSDDVCEVNLRLFFNLLENADPNCKIINFGSGSEYSRAHWQPEMDEVYFGANIPEDSHSLAKYVISKYIDGIKSNRITTFRIFGIFGKYEDYKFKFISNSIAKALVGLPIVINRDAIYDYVYIDDFCKLIDASLEKSFNYTSYNITSAEPSSLSSIAKIIIKHVNSSIELRILQDGIGVHYTGKNNRLSELVPEFKFHNIESSIKDLIVYYKANIDQVDRASLELDEYINYAKKINS